MRFDEQIPEEIRSNYRSAAFKAEIYRLLAAASFYSIFPVSAVATAQGWSPLFSLVGVAALAVLVPLQVINARKRDALLSQYYVLRWEPSSSEAGFAAVIQGIASKFNIQDKHKIRRRVFWGFMSGSIILCGLAGVVIGGLTGVIVGIGIPVGLLIDSRALYRRHVEVPRRKDVNKEQAGTSDGQRTVSPKSLWERSRPTPTPMDDHVSKVNFLRPPTPDTRRRSSTQPGPGKGRCSSVRDSNRRPRR